LEGKTIAFRGVALNLLLDKVGAPLGKALRGRAMCQVVIASGRDSYGVALALAETDPMFRKEQILVADEANGAPIGDQAGPLRLVVEGDLRGARFVRQLNAITITTTPNCGREP
jgi:DMSO/TMAO reductase YedYZ molybdopterin-dependent catalytic subunit